MTSTWKNRARVRGGRSAPPAEVDALANRKLKTSMMFFTDFEGRALLQNAAKILEGNGVKLEAKGHTGVINDFIRNDLRDYMARKLKAAGLAKDAIEYELDKLDRLAAQQVKEDLEKEAGGSRE